MFEPRNIQSLATQDEVRDALERERKYSVQIGVDVKAGTDWPVFLILYQSKDGEQYWIETQYFGSHSEEDGEVYANLKDAYEALEIYYDAD